VSDIITDVKCGSAGQTMSPKTTEVYVTSVTNSTVGYSALVPGGPNRH